MLYSKLVELEEDIQKALTKELAKQREISLGVIENVLGSVLHRQLVLADKRGERPETSETKKAAGKDIFDNKISSEEKNKREPASRKEEAKSPNDPNPRPSIPQKTPFSIMLRDLPITGDGTLRRYQTVGNMIEINSAHPDFRNRVKQKRGRLQFTDRLGAYLANVITASYRDQYYSEKGKDPKRDEVYNDLLRDASQLEQALKRQMPRLQNELEKVGKKNLAGPSTDKEFAS